MKIILLQDVAKVGRKHEIKEVADGFARNFLLNRGKALPASKENLAKVLEKNKNILTAKQNQAETFLKLSAILAEKKPVIKVKANNEGHLFSGLKAKDIAEFLKQETGLAIAEDWLVIDKPFKTTGRHKVILKKDNQTASFELAVEAI